jgi:putative two-component system response regulator
VEQEKKRILVVDDDELVRRFLVSILSRMGYEVFEAFDGVDCLEKVKTASPDIILLDVEMPRMDGVEAARRLKETDETKLIPIVIVSAFSDVEERVKALEAGVDDFLAKPVERTELRARVQSLLKVKAYNDHMVDYQKVLEEEVGRRTEQLRNAFEELKAASNRLKHASLDTIFRLSQAAEYKDEDTGGHIRRMGYYTAIIAPRLKMNDEEVEAILYAAPMHDIGKIGIPDRVLLKPGKLDAQEWETMKQHTVIGSNLLKGSESFLIKMAEIIALTHHEKWDGSGYPNGLGGENIPLAGRITAIADVFDALTSKRPYKEAFPFEKALAIIAEGRGNHFDPAVTDAFLDLQKSILEIRASFTD